LGWVGGGTKLASGGSGVASIVTWCDAGYAVICCGCRVVGKKKP
jgi:hypothetical protein